MGWRNEARYETGDLPVLANGVRAWACTMHHTGRKVTVAAGRRSHDCLVGLSIKPTSVAHVPRLTRAAMLSSSSNPLPTRWIKTRLDPPLRRAVNRERLTSWETAARPPGESPRGLGTQPANITVGAARRGASNTSYEDGTSRSPEPDRSAHTVRAERPDHSPARFCDIAFGGAWGRDQPPAGPARALPSSRSPQSDPTRTLSTPFHQERANSLASPGAPHTCLHARAVGPTWRRPAGDDRCRAVGTSSTRRPDLPPSSSP